MLGSIWRPAYPLVIPTALSTVVSCAATGAGIGLHAMGAARRSVRSTLIGAVISVALALVGAVVWGMYGTVLLAAVGTLISMAISWHFFVKAMQESGRVPVPRWMAMTMGGRHPGGGASPPPPPRVVAAGGAAQRPEGGRDREAAGQLRQGNSH